MRKIFLLVATLLLVACVTVRKIGIDPVDTAAIEDPPVIVQSPVKAHLVDGSTVVFTQGAAIHRDKVVGQGHRFDLLLDESAPVTEVPLETVAAMESYTDDVDQGATFVVSTATTVFGGFAGLGLAKAIFGSCPTTYSIENGAPVLEAESFSYSIAPAFEARDVDRLGIASPDDGRIVLEMRNEALETHYINHVELIEVRHAKGTRVFPDPSGRPLTVYPLVPPAAIVDREGRSLHGLTDAADGDPWVTSDERLAAISAGDVHDHIDLTFDAGESVAGYALVLRLRNSLLNTVLLYDVMLKDQGPAALDWMVRDLDSRLQAYPLASWYRREMGMTIEIRDGNRFRRIARLADTGPIAWKETAVPLPTHLSGKVQLRLSFVADNWQVDQVALAELGRDSSERRVPVRDVVDRDGLPLPEALPGLARADGSYVITRPADVMQLVFDVGAGDDRTDRTWLLAAEGYYLEWMRREWLDNRSDRAFEPGDEAIMSALERWKPQRDSLRERFDATRIPVR